MSPLTELSDGRLVLLRRARAEDEGKLAFLHQDLSPRSQAFSLGGAELLDSAHGWVAEADGGALVGVALFSLDRLGRGRVAITVRDDYQQAGLGTALFRQMIASAARAGAVTMTGSVLPTNEPMLRLSRRFGAEVAYRDGGEVLLSVPLSSG